MTIRARPSGLLTRCVPAHTKVLEGAERATGPAAEEDDMAPAIFSCRLRETDRGVINASQRLRAFQLPAGLRQRCAYDPSSSTPEPDTRRSQPKSCVRHIRWLRST